MKSHGPRLAHMIEAIEDINSIVAGREDEIESFGRHDKLLLERNFEIISEASRHLNPDFKAQNSDIPWKDIADIGNILRHDYVAVELSILAGTVKDDLEPLEKVCRAELERLQERQRLLDQVQQQQRQDQARENDQGRERSEDAE